MNMATEEVDDVTTTVEGDGDAEFFSTPEAPVVATPPDAHQGTIESVTLDHLNNDKQTAIIRIGLKSRNVPLEGTLDVFVPKGYETGGFEDGFTVDSLPEVDCGKGDPRNDKQQSSYRMSIANSEKTAVLQVLQSIARANGRTAKSLGLDKPTNLEEFVEAHSKLLVGLDVIFTRREKGGDDPAFAHQLQIKRIWPGDAAEVSPKAFKKYVRAWEDGQ